MSTKLKQRIIQTDMFAQTAPVEVKTASFEGLEEVIKMSLQKQCKKLFGENRELAKQNDRLLQRIQKLERQASLLMGLLSDQKPQQVAL